LELESTRLAAKVQALGSCERAINQRALTISQRGTKYKCFFAKGPRERACELSPRGSAATVEDRAAALL
jgi:hypothetical protein